MIVSSPDGPRDQLTGWKEIASYVGKSVRTVQRWERRYQMPVHRVPGSAEVVLASKQEIEQWKRSAVSSEIPDIEQPGVGPVTEPAARRQRRSRWLIVSCCAALLLALLTIHLVQSGGRIKQAAAEDDAALFEGQPYALEWHAMEERRAPERVGSFLVDPAFVTIGFRDIIFNYVKRGGAGRARPFVFARLEPPPESPRLRFTYVPHADARVCHWAGFVANTGFVRKGESSIGYWVPRTGVALRLDRTSKAYVNSRASLWAFVEGEPRPLGVERPLAFQMEPGRSFLCTIAVEGWEVSAAISDGVRVDALVGAVDSPIPADSVFFADAHDGVSSSSPAGTYSMRFADIAVRDATYRTGLQLLPSPAGRLRVAIESNPNVDATALDERSLRLSRASVVAGDSSQGFACRREDVTADGVYDLVCEFDSAALKQVSGVRELRLTGRTTYGRQIAGRLILPAPVR